jgi:hypothetical protein
MVQKIFLVVLSIFLLSSCSKVKSIEIFSKPIEIAIAQPPAPSPVKLNNITWKVLNIDDNIYYGLRVRDYELLSINMLELKRYIAAQQNNLKYYKEVTGGNKESDNVDITPTTDNTTE